MVAASKVQPPAEALVVSEVLLTAAVIVEGSLAAVVRLAVASGPSVVGLAARRKCRSSAAAVAVLASGALAVAAWEVVEAEEADMPAGSPTRHTATQD